MRFWTRNNPYTELEHELRANRAEPSPEILRAVAARVDGDRRRSRRGLQLAFAGALVALSAFVAVGGLGPADSNGVQVNPKSGATPGPVDRSGRHVATSPSDGCQDPVKALRWEELARQMRETQELRPEIAACPPGKPRQDGE